VLSLFARFWSLLSLLTPFAHLVTYHLGFLGFYGMALYRAFLKWAWKLGKVKASDHQTQKTAGICILFPEKILLFRLDYRQNQVWRKILGCFVAIIAQSKKSGNFKKSKRKRPQTQKIT
jgi:hypothetical protein